MSAKVATVFYFQNGDIGAFDERGRQVASEQGNAFLCDLADKLQRGIIADQTRVLIQGVNDATDTGETVAELRPRIELWGARK
jgi:hypothetical protein